jgi:N-glycosylase/DNA lyase
VATPARFSFRRTIYSHGWYALPPFTVDHQTRTLRRIFELPGGRPAVVEMHDRNGSGITASCPSGATAAERNVLIRGIRACLRLDEEFSEFHAAALSHHEYRWIPRTGSGRLLRSATVFEDVVKMLCTTNCSWSLTEVMIGNLCTKLGVPVDGYGCTFPTAEAIAATSEKFLRKEIRAGYRAPYLLAFARAVAGGSVRPESWRSATVPTAELYDELRSIKGVGPYAAGNVLKLLGHYDYLAIDSWCRKRFSEIHRNGRKVSDRAIEKWYEPFGRWRGLFFWLDLTRDWYKRKIPF